MKTKTINKVLRAKFEDFVQSIDDSKVAALVKKNSIITGGSIASMLLGEKVNDYDIYFTNKETVLAVARYYVKKFEQLNSIANGKKREKKKGGEKHFVIAVTDHNPDSKTEGRVQLVVASKGVAASDDADKITEYSDPEAEAARELAGVDITDKTQTAIADNDAQPYRPVYLSDNAITLSHKVQLIIRFYGEPEEIHTNYDFIHAMNYWRSDTRELITKKEALEALLSRTLVYCGSKYPVASILRAKKFIQRGWNINAGQYLKMAFQVSELDLTDLEVLRDQLTGMDMLYMTAAIHAIEETLKKKPDTILDSSYFTEVINRVFG